MTETVMQANTLDQWFERAAQHRQPAWAVTRRANARGRFERLGWPSTRLEDWKQTNIKAITSRDYIQSSELSTIDAAVLATLLLNNEAPRLVFVDGLFSAELSNLDNLPKGLVLRNLSGALSDGLVTEDQLGAIANDEDHAFTALNDALFQDGVLIDVADGDEIEPTIQLLNLCTGGAGALLVAPRHVIHVGNNASVTFVEDYVGLADHADLIAPITEITAGDGARVTHVVRGLTSADSSLIYGLFTKQGRDSALQSHQLLTGGGLTRGDVRVQLAGQGGDATVNGLMLGAGSQHTDINIRIEHAVPHCTSHQLIKGIFDDKARGVFSGCIVVAEDAQKTDAVQTNRNLLLSDDARAFTKPQLEIYADDVKCAHGATTGQLDEDALYYLMARGIDRQSAYNLLIYAFAHEVLDNMPLVSVREQAETILNARFRPEQ